MKRILLLSFLWLYCLLAACPPGKKAIYIIRNSPIQPFALLFKAMCEIETHSNPLAYNPREKATGIIQIRPIMLKDYNRRAHKSYKLSQMHSIKISREIYDFYSKKFKPYEFEKFAHFWNGRGKSNKNYWHRLKSELAKENKQ